MCERVTEERRKHGHLIFFYYTNEEEKNEFKKIEHKIEQQKKHNVHINQKKKMYMKEKYETLNPKP